MKLPNCTIDKHKCDLSFNWVDYVCAISQSWIIVNSKAHFSDPAGPRRVKFWNSLLFDFIIMILVVVDTLKNWSKYMSHLSKGSSGCKQKCTQFPTPFSCTVFHALSHGVIHFVLRVISKNLEIEFSDWLLKNFNQWESGFLTYNTPNKMNPTM